MRAHVKSRENVGRRVGGGGFCLCCRDAARRDQFSCIFPNVTLDGTNNFMHHRPWGVLFSVLHLLVFDCPNL